MILGRFAVGVVLFFSALVVAPPAHADSDALAVLETLPVKGRAPKTGYQRSLFGERWTDDVTVADGHNVQFVALNGSGSKLDAFLERSVTYEVGRCPTTGGRVISTVTAELVNAIPLGQRPPEYMLSGKGRDGTTNVVLAQFHLPNGAEVRDVRIDGTSVSSLQFEEQGRPSAVLGVTLAPRERVQVAVEFLEPAADAQGSVTIQPLATDQPTRLMDVPC